MAIAETLLPEYDQEIATTRKFLERVPVGGPEVAMRGGEGGLAGAAFDEARIYLGETAAFRKPAEVDLEEVYDRIPEYRTIVREKPDPDGARYYFLLMAAGKRFRTALQAVSDRNGYDLVGGLGAIRLPDREVPRITDLVIESLPD